jgi:hypothetical protein
MWTVSRNLLLATMAALVLWGCGSKQPEGATVSSATGTGPRKAANSGQAALVRDMVAAVPASKATVVPMVVRFQLRQRPDVGQPVDVDLVMIPSSDAVDQVSGQVQADDGLELVSGAQIPPAQRPAEGVAISHSIKLLPKRNGIFTFSAVLTVDYGGQRVTQTYSIPVIAGSGITTLPPANTATPTRVPATAATQ